MGPLERQVVDALRLAGLGSDAAMQAQMDDMNLDALTDGQRWDLTFRMVEALSLQLIAVARAIDDRL